MGRPKGHPGPVKPEAEKMNKPVRVGFTSVEKNLLIKRAASLHLSVSKYIRTLFVADITKNG